MTATVLPITDTPRWSYPTFNATRGECRLRMWRVVDATYAGGEAYVAVVTELADNPSASVTNSAERIYAALREALTNEYDVPDAIPLRLIEHYRPWSEARGDTYDEVTFCSTGGTCPSWSRLTPARLAMILPGVTL